MVNMDVGLGIRHFIASIREFAYVSYRKTVTDIAANGKQFTETHISVHIILVFSKRKERTALVNLTCSCDLDWHSNADNIESLQRRTYRTDGIRAICPRVMWRTPG